MQHSLQLVASQRLCLKIIFNLNFNMGFVMQKDHWASIQQVVQEYPHISTDISCIGKDKGNPGGLIHLKL